ncbi:DEAD/DEAH box helicase [Shouchella miscanthi]|uniref:DEAD/DEAH box helicase n=1 Tax=Shouchella miscanthi TaxID=2598861 RepID=UPI0011A44F72|nr:DEAD/DEAH box helicase [Shouchella miscanthi]
MKPTIQLGLFELKEEMKQRKHQRMTIKMRSFMKRIGQKRRTEHMVATVNKHLKRLKVRVYSSTGTQWHRLKMEEWVTFSFQEMEHSPHLVKVRTSDFPFRLYVHQEEALRRLDKIPLPFSGILSIPTGGGKTVVAVHWLLKEGVSKGRKVLWLTHRHDLLDQAFSAIRTLATDDLVEKVKSISCRLISSEETHESVKAIQAVDQIVIGTNQSIAGQLSLLQENWLKANEDLLIIVDEAHHAVSETYELILTTLSKKANPTILGLTATPFRTIEEEKGLLKKRFPADIVYKLDVATLIARGILAEPFFKELKTGVEKLPTLSGVDIQHIHTADRLPPKVEHYLAVHQARNTLIVKEYGDHKQVYGKTLVFAMNRKHAILLTEQFVEAGISADYFISGEEKKEDALKRFKENELDVLVNVNMLTEGTDLPDVQTVFLARPTTSAILMTQMIGRAMRGVEAGGTASARIVHFHDDWPETISWITPSELYRDEAAVIKQRSFENQEMPLSTSIVDKWYKSLPTQEAEAHRFVETIPVGVYSFIDPSLQQTIDILVYEHLATAYEAWLENLKPVAKNEVSAMLDKTAKTYFKEKRHTFGFHEQDLAALYRYFRATQQKPVLRWLKDRDKVDITRMAEEIKQRGLYGDEKKHFIDTLWNKEQSFIAVYFGFDKLEFRKRLELELIRLEEPELFNRNEPNDSIIDGGRHDLPSV